MEEYDDMLEEAQEEVPEDIGEEERFEIPDVKTRKEGSKTVIEDFSGIAEKFGREEKHLSKYIQNEIGTAGHVENGELIMNGEFRRGNVQRRIEQYAEEYVFCPECGRPDTSIIKEKGVEMMKCQACGARTSL
ncbi:MAG: translation initiation factor IF-2 subunit beta [Candidatus Nanohaloarchaea archaeon]